MIIPGTHMTSLRERQSAFAVVYFSTFPIHVSWEQDQPYNVRMGCMVGTKSVFVLRYSCYLSAVGCSQVELSYTTSKFDSCCAYNVLEKPVFYGHLTAASASLWIPPQFVYCCLVTPRGFMPASLIVIP